MEASKQLPQGGLSPRQRPLGPEVSVVAKPAYQETQGWWPKVIMPNHEGHAPGLSVTGFSRTSSCLVSSWPSHMHGTSDSACCYRTADIADQPHAPIVLDICA